MSPMADTKFFLLIALMLFLFDHVMPQPTFLSNFCFDSGNYTTNSMYEVNLKQALSNLTAESSDSGFYNSTAGEAPDEVFAVYYCRGDMTLKLCNDCVKAAAESILEVCPNQKEAVIWYSECTLRYANQTIFSLLSIEPVAFRYTLDNYFDPVRLGQVINRTMEGVIMQAAYNSSLGFATGKGVLTLSDTLFGLVQCSIDILGNSCEACLRLALSEVPLCCGTGRKTMMVFLPSCQLRYSLTPFFSATTTPSSNSLPPPPSASAPRASYSKPSIR